jgi:hypothetical protein
MAKEDALTEAEELKVITRCPNYRISNLGNVYRVLKKGNLRKLKPRLAFGGYLQTVVFTAEGERKPFYIHRLVAKAFLDTQEKPQVNHKNGIKHDNSAENLEWVTPKENSKHASKTGLKPIGSKNVNAKLTQQQVLEIYKLKGILGCVKVAKTFGVSKPVVLGIWKKKRYVKELAAVL